MERIITRVLKDENPVRDFLIEVSKGVIKKAVETAATELVRTNFDIWKQMKLKRKRRELDLIWREEDEARKERKRQEREKEKKKEQEEKERAEREADESAEPTEDATAGEAPDASDPEDGDDTDEGEDGEDGSI